MNGHGDLKNMIWTNKKEIPDNSIDDDHNGYVDDIHGWNFRGMKDGTVVENELTPSAEDSLIYGGRQSKGYGSQPVAESSTHSWCEDSY